MRNSKLVLMIYLIFVSCTVITDPNAKIEEDPFFGPAQLMMTKAEIRIYQHLPDQESKDEFKKEFWINLI